MRTLRSAGCQRHGPGLPWLASAGLFAASRCSGRPAVADDPPARFVREAREWAWSSARFRDEYGVLKLPPLER
jgi:hypothetical protein